MDRLKRKVERNLGLRGPRTVLALMLREMATTYGRSPGGYIWAILEPVGAIALLTVVFSFMFHAPPLGKSFPLFYATGFLPFTMFNDVGNKVAQTIRFSKPLLSYPSVTIVDAIAARFVLNLLTHVMVLYIVIGGILVVFDTRALLNFPAIVLAVTMAASLGLGVGTLNCYLMSAFPIWERSWQILTRPLFVISGIFFLFDTLPEAAHDVLWFNPLIHIVGEMRKGLYPTYSADYVSPAFVFMISFACLALGLLFLRRDYRRLVNE